MIRTTGWFDKAIGRAMEEGLLDSGLTLEVGKQLMKEIRYWDGDRRQDDNVMNRRYVQWRDSVE